MKKIVIILFLFLYRETLLAQLPGEWTWMSGDSIPNSSGIFGTQGVASSNNKPAALYQSCSWSDEQGNFWLFGGANFTSDGTFRPYNSLWKYTVATNEWTWMKGNNAPFSYGVYGVESIPDSDNTPGSRYMAASWVDTAGKLWLFGGYGYDGGAFGIGNLNDLWSYDPITNEWTWMKGANSAYQAGVYGHKGIADSTNVLGARSQSDSWTDTNNNLWLFGGWEHGNSVYYNDLWKYSITTDEWTWMKGDSLPNQPAHFGTLGVEDSLSKPGCRQCQTHWVDSSGNLWMFGGGLETQDIFQDIWEFNVTTDNWIWWGGYGGSNTYVLDTGLACVAQQSNWLESRSEMAISWKSKNDLWLYGGDGYSQVFNNVESMNQLWKFSLDNKIWTRVSGVDYYVDGFFGTLGMPSQFTHPSSKFGFVSWQDQSDNLWLFGGVYTFFPNMQTPCFNDLWRYVPDSTCGVYTFTTEIPQHKNEFEIYPNPASDLLQLIFSLPKERTVSIFNSTGTIVISEEEYGNINVDVSKLRAGIYLICISDPESYSSQKVVITR